MSLMMIFLHSLFILANSVVLTLAANFEKPNFSDAKRQNALDPMK
jgi:hypothetical protein